MKCAYCRKKKHKREYYPYCSYHCLKWAEIYAAELTIDDLKRKKEFQQKYFKEHAGGLKK